MNDIKDKVVLVTGAASGIGRATAELFAENGAKVIVSDIDLAPGEALVASINASGGSAYFVAADVSKSADCEALVKASINQFGDLHIAFNNAGIGGESNPVGNMSLEGWRKVIAVNLDSVFYCMKYQLQHMEKKGRGAIVNMSSILGQVGFANSAAYVAAKHGVVGLTQTAALEYAVKGIRINAVGPAFINTPLLDGLDEGLKNALVSMHAIGRLGESREVAELVLWLSSDRASFVNGSYYPVDGGYLAR